MKNPRYFQLSILLFFTAVLFSACNGAGGNEGKKSFAKITFEDGKTLKLSVTDLKGGLDNGNTYSVNMMSGSTVIIFNTMNVQPVKEGDVNELNITINDVLNKAPLDEEYRSFYHENKATGEEGNASITFNSVSGDNVSATFSGVINSPSGKSATIEGELHSVKE